jgi:hypothetical protein
MKDLTIFDSAIIVDLGGTLAHRGERPKQSYMERFHEDQVDETVRELVNMVSSTGTMIIILTGQRERSRKITEEWLRNKGVRFDSLIMKPDDSPLDTLVWKKEVYENEIKDNIHIKYVLEDREDTVEMWRNHNVRCFQTASGQDREYYKQNSSLQTLENQPKQKYLQNN